MLGSDEPQTTQTSAAAEDGPLPDATEEAFETLEQLEPVEDVENVDDDDDPEFDGGTSGPARKSGTGVASTGAQGASTGMLGLTGIVVMLAGGLLAVVQTLMPASAGGFVTVLERAGLQPGAVLVLGAVLLAGGGLRRRQSALEQQVTGLRQGMESNDARAATRLQQMFDHRDEKAPAAGDELHSVLLALHKQDEKTNNLTRAIKMYGKPLIEITNIATEASTRIADVSAQVEALKTAADKQQERLQESLKNDFHRLQADPAVGRGVAELQAALAKSGQTMQQLHHELKTDLDGHKERAARLETLAEGSRKQLEQWTAKLGQVEQWGSKLAQLEQWGNKLGQLEQWGAKLAQLETSLAETRKHFAAGIEKVLHARNAPADTGLDATLREIQESVTGLAGAVARLGNAPRAAAAPSAPQAAPAPQRPPAEPAPATSRTPAAEPAREPAREPAPDGPGALAQSISGSRKDGGASFFQSIAKLKKLRKD